MLRLLRRFLVSLAFLPAVVGAQRTTLDAVKLGDTTVVHTLQLRDGSSVVGRIVALTADSVHMQLQSGSITVARRDVMEVREARRDRVRDGRYWFENPHASRLLFSPTAFPLEKGTGYFSDIYLFFVGMQWAVGDRFSFGAGMSLFPAEDFSDNLFYITPKLTVVDAPKFKLSVGGFLGWLGAAAGSGESGSLGILYGVASTGTRDSNLSFGLGYGYYGGNIADTPIFMIGGQGRVARGLSFISENWVLRSDGETEGIISYGLRFLGERMSIDLAFLNPLGAERVFPGIPFVGFAVKF